MKVERNMSRNIGTPFSRLRVCDAGFVEFGRWRKGTYPLLRIVSSVLKSCC